jgi:hypothetical protein
MTIRATITLVQIIQLLQDPIHLRPPEALQAVVAEVVVAEVVAVYPGRPGRSEF